DMQMVDATHYTATCTPAAATETAAASFSVAAGSYADSTRIPYTTLFRSDFTVDTVAPTIAIDAIAVDNTVNAGEAAVGFAISGTTDAESGQTVTVQILDGSSAVVDSYTVPVAGGTWSVDVTAAQAQALAD